MNTEKPPKKSGYKKVTNIMARQQRKVNDFYYGDTPEILLELGIECDKYAEKPAQSKSMSPPDKPKGY